MNFLYKFILIFFFFFVSVNLSISEEKTAFINIDYLIQNSNIGKKMITDINKLDKKNLDKLKKKNKILEELELSIKKKKNVITEEAFNKEVTSFKQKLQEFTKEKNQIVNEFNDYKKKELANIFKQISPIINDYMKENSVNILLDSKNIFMGSIDSNLTEDVLKKINKEFK
jgi:outer membrane protein